MPTSDLANRIARLERAVRKSGSSPSLAHSAIHDGGIDEYRDETIVQRVGEQVDGTNTTVQFNGPIPPAPSTATAVGGELAAIVTWDGTWTDDAVAPLDLARIDVHLVTSAGADPLLVPSSASIVAQGWGEASLTPPPGVWYAVLVAWTTSGKYSASPASAAFEVTLPASVVEPVAPSMSPEASVTGLPKQILVMTGGVDNETPVEYEYHLAMTNVSPPDETTLATTSTSTGVSLAALPDGTPEGTPLEYGVQYYVATWAKSGTEYAAAPSPWVPVMLSQIDTADIAARAITGELFSSIIAVSSLFRAGGDSGQRTENDIDGYRVYDSTGALVVNLSPLEVVILADYMFAKFLETGGAKLGGKTEGPAGGEFAMGTGILPAPGAALQFSQNPTMVALNPPLTSEGLAQIASDGTSIFRFYVDTTKKKIIAWRTSFAGSNIGGTAAVDLGSGTSLKIVSVDDAAVNSEAAYLRATLSDGSLRWWRIPRPTPTTWGARAAATPVEPPGVSSGGYPTFGVQRGATDVLLAHVVSPAQSFGGVAYADGEIMVRRYTPSLSGSDLILTLNKTIRTGIIALSPGGTATDVLSVIMDASGGTFDTPAESGKTSIAVSWGFTSGASKMNIANAPTTGSSVTATPALAANAWTAVVTSRSSDVLYDGTAFWDGAVTPSGSSIAKRPGNAVAQAGVGMGFTYWDGAHETMLSPVLTAELKARFPAKWTIPTIPTGVTQVRLYLSGDPATRTRYELVDTFAAIEDQPLLIETPTIQPPSGDALSPPPEESDFPGGDVYKMTTAHPDTATFGDGKTTARDPLMPTDVVNLRTMNAPKAVGVRVKTTDTTLTTATYTLIPFDTSRILANGMAWTDDAYVVPITGIYQVNLALRFLGANTGDRIALISVNDDLTSTQRRFLIPATVSRSISVPGNQLLSLNAGDTVSVYGYQNSGSDLAVNGNPSYTWFDLAYVGPA